MTAHEMDAHSQAMIDGISNYAGDADTEARCLGAVAALDQIARCAYVVAHPKRKEAARAPDEETHLLYVLLKAYYEGGDAPPPHGLSHQWAANAAVYLNAVFTCGQRMADRTIAEANALGPAACAERMRAQQLQGAIVP